MEEDGTRNPPPLSTPDGKSARPLKESRSPCIGERIRWITAHPWLTHCEKTIATSILSRAQDHDGEFCAWPSLATIAADSGVERRNLARLMDRISRSGVFKRIRGVRTSTTYEFPRILPEYPEKPEKTLKTTTSSLRTITTPDDSGLPLGGHQDYHYPSGRDYHPKSKEKTEEKRIQKPPIAPLVCDIDLKNPETLTEDAETMTEPTPAEPAKPHPADEAWNSIAEPYDATPPEPAPAAPAHTRRARTVPEKPGVTKNGQTALDLGTEEEFSDSRPPEPGPVPKPKRHKYNGPRSRRFPDFWAVWRKPTAKVAAHKVWAANGLDAIADDIIADVEDRNARHAQWQNKQFIPNPDRYLRNEMWEDEIIEAETGGARHDKPTAAKRPETRRDQKARVQCDVFASFGPGEETRAEAGTQTGPGVVLTGNFGAD